MMRALTVVPGQGQTAAVLDVPEPALTDGAVLVETHAVGICGTDREILRGHYGEAPPTRMRLVLGHEAVGRVIEVPPHCGLHAGDWVVGIVRRPDPVPCGSCAAGEWDMCRNGGYTERGIKRLDGFGSERFRLEPDFAVRVPPELGELGVLLEPASVVVKAWEHVERIGQRALFQPERVLVTGAGPIGLLAALLGAQRGLEVHVLDRVTGGPKPDLVTALGAIYHTGGLNDVSRQSDIVLECTGATPVIFDAIASARPNGIICLAGVSTGGRHIPIDVGAVNRDLVLENNVVFGTVNANRRHYEQAAHALSRADRSWLERIIARRVPLERWAEAMRPQPADVKTILTFQTPP